ncbi:MAG: 2-dehydropantoate 2-reductase [Chloroflexota bacterium]
MKITILGAGAMGSLFGGRFAQAGLDVQLLDVNQEHIDAINHTGLHLDLDDGQYTIRLPALRPEEATDIADLLIVFTKTFHTRVALAAAQHLIDDSTHVLSVQNGLGNLERIADFVPHGRIIIGMTDSPADFLGPGRVASHGRSRTTLMLADGQKTPFLDKVHGAFEAAGVVTIIDPDVWVGIWEKVAFNVALNAICGITRATPGTLVQSSASLALANAVASEACAAARANQVNVDEDRVHSTIEKSCHEHANHKPSMLQDLLAGRRTEVDSLNGAVVERAKQVGMEAPLNEMLYRLVKLAEMA